MYEYVSANWTGPKEDMPHQSQGFSMALESHTTGLSSSVAMQAS